MKARGTDIAKISLAAMKTISSPGELGLRLNAYDAPSTGSPTSEGRGEPPLSAMML